MKVLHLSTSDLSGGAAKAAYRSSRSLQQISVESEMLVSQKCSADDSVILDSSFRTKINPYLNRSLKQFLLGGTEERFSLQWFADSSFDQCCHINPDLIHLHWVCNGYIQIETLAKLEKPIIWTLHDMWPMTGGCHYSGGCNLYQSDCSDCPQLSNARAAGQTARLLQRKLKSWKDLNMTIITPSQWLGDCARNSKVFQDFPIEVLPNCINTDQYKPLPKEFSRKVLNLDPNAFFILFCAGSTTKDARKGFALLVEAIKKLQTITPIDFELLIIGEEKPKEPLDLGVRTHYLGRFNDDLSLQVAYNAADVFIAPSMQDNLPNTVVEASACGIPCVAFKIGGMPDLIEHQHTGFLAQPFDTSSLAEGIKWVAHQSVHSMNLASKAREKAVACFGMKSHANRLREIYQRAASIEESDNSKNLVMLT